MDGWATKIVKEHDLRPPLISSSTFKVNFVSSFLLSAFLSLQKRLLNTIGVSRGFGDHHLFTVEERLPIKPFLSPVPEVRILKINFYQ